MSTHKLVGLHQHRDTSPTYLDVVVPSNIYTDLFSGTESECAAKKTELESADDGTQWFSLTVEDNS